MARGRKTRTYTVKEKAQPSSKSNYSAPARNLRKGDLGAVIFGCKHNTIKECYFKELFGLPAMHFAYVKNITQGLTLFLFNYSDRKLHGIFEAISPGQMNINPYAWTDDGTEHTPFPAQVRVRIQRRCCTLTEDQFRPIIAENYYEQKLFWFELDRAQTSKLIALFTSSPYNEDASCLLGTPKWNTLCYPLPTSDTKEAGNFTKNSISEAICGISDQANTQCGSLDAPSIGEELNGLPSYSSGVKGVVVSDRSTFLPQKKWSSLFNTSSDSDNVRKDENSRTQASKSTCHPSDQSNSEWESSRSARCQDKQRSTLSETQGVDLVAGVDCEEYDNWELRWEDPSALTEVTDSVRKITLIDDAITCETRDKFRNSESIKEWESDSFSPCLNLETRPSESATGCNAEEMYPREEPNCKLSYSSNWIDEMISEENPEKDAPYPSFTTGAHLDKTYSPLTDTLMVTNSADIESVFTRLIQEIEGLKGSQLKQIMKISYLEQELVESKVQIQQLKNHCNVLESGPFSSVGPAGVEDGWFDRSYPNMGESVLIMGGYDGSSWLSDLGSYSPSLDTMKPLCPMTFVRSYASAAKLHGELFIIGGVDGDVWYDTVESYNLESETWVSRPSLNKKKGSSAGASLYDKIFAIGGGDGVGCFSEMEMFDPNIGRWIFTQSMQYKRFASAAAEINNALYVTGGFDGRNYLSSVERFDPREYSWTGLGNMSTRRGCHSVAVLNEKLYVLGGFNGSHMVSTVEIFDPRNGAWMTGEPMKCSRGYSGAFEIGGKIYIIGGLKDSDKILDTIECYKEGHGWEMTNLSAVGKRCFFSTVVL